MRRTLLTVALLTCAAVARAADAPPDPVKAAVEKALRRVETGAASYVTNRQCFSCHHQAMAMTTLTAARQRGFEIDADKLKGQTEFTLQDIQPKAKQLAKGQGLGGGSTHAGYLLFALDAVGHPADETTTALVEYLLARQKADGSWPGTGNRPPTEGSTFTSTALALCGLRAYSPKDDGKDAVGLREKIDKAVEKGRDWLLNAKVTTTEDKVFHLRGLVWVGADKDAVEKARAALVQEQRDDGGWAQLSDLTSDGYATGSVLVALRHAGLAADDAVYKKGVKFLVETQKEDGSWLVEKRARPVQTFFDNGDPHGKNQFISYVATAWAAQALLEAAPK
jgi:N-acyl-D-amino-acid deacylase